MPIVHRKSGDPVDPALVERLKALSDISDDDIDFSDIPELTEDDFKRARVMKPGEHCRLTVLDEEIAEQLPSDMKSRDEIVNRVLRAFLKTRTGEPAA